SRWPVLAYQPASGSYDPTEAIAIVSPSGRIASFEVNHSGVFAIATPLAQAFATVDEGRPPLVDAITPGAVQAGVSAITIGISGTSFAPTSTVNYDGANHNPAFIDSTKLELTLGAQDLVAGFHSLTVSNFGVAAATTSGASTGSTVDAIS